ncbi:MAG: hypothetical protein JKY34_12285 [Kordiimonadaceae bacterium]|nr:hypothetical protein [Kordiimonadaceae bacterium]
MVKLPSKDEAIYMAIHDILENEPNPNIAEFLCVTLLVGFKKTDDLLNVVQQSDNQEKCIETIKKATELMSYEKKNHHDY